MTQDNGGDTTYLAPHLNMYVVNYWKQNGYADNQGRTNTMQNHEDNQIDTDINHNHR